LTSPDYSLKDFKAVLINGYMKNKSLLTEIMDIDLSDVLCKIQVPYLILQGDTDSVTSTKMISAFIENVRNKNIVFHRIQNNGHLPGTEGMDYITKNGFDFLDSRIAE
jgi:pimeloyl-ACP methyl ester carboxylesterase